METRELSEIKIADIAPTKFGIDMMADAIAEETLAGKLDPLSVMVQMAALEQLTKAVREKIAEAAKEQLYKHPKQVAEILGAKVQAVDLPKYDYRHVDGWFELSDTISALTEKRKAIEEEEKKYRRGELPVLSVSQSIKVNLAK
jgi:uncharacterized protein YbgA (DUF1722 family)